MTEVGAYGPGPIRPRIDWSQHEREAVIEGRRVSYVEVGSGTLGFILIHGMGGYWQHWVQTLPFLARRGRAIALDLPGFGRSGRPPGSVSIEHLANVAAQLCDEANLREVILFGHSMGGPIGLNFARSRPDIAKGLVMVGGAVRTFAAVLGGRDLGHLAHERLVEMAAIVTELLGAGLPTPRPLKRLVAGRALLRRLVLWPYLQAPAEISVDGAALLLEGAGATGVFPTARAIGRSEPYGRLADVRLPILSIGGRYDRICPPADLEHFDRIAATATTVLVDGAAHMVMLERPKVFNERAGRFLAELGMPADVAAS